MWGGFCGFCAFRVLCLIDKKDKGSYPNIRKLEKETKKSSIQILRGQEWENTDNEREDIINEIIQEKLLKLKDMDCRTPQMLKKIDPHFWKNMYF